MNSENSVLLNQSAAIDVHLVDAVPKTTSLNIAEVFGKQHKDVLRAIERLDCPEEFNRRNFALVEYTDEKGEARPMYELTKDGAVLLIMGFTGRAAMGFKIAYIEAFNQLEQQARRSWALRGEDEAEPSDAELREAWREERRWRRRYTVETVKLKSELLNLYRQIHATQH